MLVLFSYFRKRISLESRAFSGDMVPPYATRIDEPGDSSTISSPMRFDIKESFGFIGLFFEKSSIPSGRQEA
jgi:hypothetical protein